MAKLFPFRGEEASASAEPRLVDIDDDAAEAVFAALSSETSRAILSRLYEGPETASAVAESADTSIQNARYHLEKLESAGLIEAVDTWYSSRGTEMTVYAPTSEPLVVAAGNEESKGVLRRALERVVGAVAVLALASVVIDRLVGRSGSLFRWIGGGPDPGDTGTPDGNGTAAVPTDTPLATGGDDGTGVPDAETPTAFATEGGTSTETATVSGSTRTPTDAPAESGTPTPTESPTPTPTESPTPTPTESPTPTPMESPTHTPTETVVDAAGTTVDGAVDTALSLPPGALFFAGGLAVIAAGAAWWYWSEYRPMYAT
jgi:DNA-binding transcriptional ArsR family regulator